MEIVVDDDIQECLTDTRLASKEALLVAAQELFAVRSYMSVSTREIAKRANVNLGAIQYHFGSKAELFIEAVRAMLNRKWHDVIYGMFGPDEPLGQDEAIRRFCRFVYMFISEICYPDGPDVCCVIYRELLSSVPANEEFAQRLINTIADEYYKHFDARVLKLLSQVAPKLTKEEIVLASCSVYAECRFLHMDAPLYECLRGASLIKEPLFSKMRFHTVKFLLRGMGISESKIDRALNDVISDNLQLK